MTTESVDGPARNQGALLGYPRGAVLVVMVEFWERFSFYSMLSILALFLTAPQAQGGFGWSAAAALRLVGIYTGLMYALPIVGGLLADRFLGHRRAIAIGASLMVAGHFLMATPVVMPLLVDVFTGADTTTALHHLQDPLGGWSPPGALSGRGEPLSYLLVSGGFFVALACLVAGNAMMKSTLVVVLGDLFSPTDPRREGAYAYYYLSISVGALVAGLASGWVAQRFGWHYGFTMAGAGMAVALGLYLRLGTRWLGPARSPSTPQDQPSPSRHTIRGRVTILAALAALLCIYEIGAFQLWGAWSLFIEDGVDRRIGDFTIPTPWYSALNAATVIPVTPLLATLWVYLSVRRRDPDIIQKYALGLLLGGACLAMFALASGQASGGEKAHWVIPALAVIITSIGEIVAWTSTYGAVYRLAPANLRSVSMGAFYAATMGLGGFLAGWLGQATERIGYTAYFEGLAAATLLAAAAALALRPILVRLAAAAGASLRATS